MNVQTADELPSSAGPQLLEHLQVARLGNDLLLLRPRERVRTGRGDGQSLAGGRLAHLAAKPCDLRERLLGRLADGRVRLDQAGEELGLQPVRAEQLLDPGRQRERLGVDELQLLLDADRQRPAEVTFHAPRARDGPAASQA